MNMQAIMKQAQKIQTEMSNEKEKIDNTIYESSSSIVTVQSNGKKQIVSIKIDADSLDKEDIEMLSDMLLVAINENNKKIDKDVEEKLGKYTKGMPGLF